MKECAKTLQINILSVKSAFESLVKGENNFILVMIPSEGIIRHRGRGYQLEKVFDEETVDARAAMEESEETTQSIFTSTPPPVNKKRQIEPSSPPESEPTQLSFSEQQQAIYSIMSYSLYAD